MNEKKRVIVLVSSDPSDIYFSCMLAKKLNVVGVFVENHAIKRIPITSRIAKLVKLLVSPAALYRRIQHELFGRYFDKVASDIAVKGFANCSHDRLQELHCPIIYTSGYRDINEQKYVEHIDQLRPDVIAVCGTSMLKDPLLSIASAGTLNLHGGLSQYYRGVWTTMWAIYNNEPEYVGATVHYVNKGVDDGDVIYQGRPKMEPGDNHETLYVKVVKLGIEMMIKAIADIESGLASKYHLNGKGKLYLRDRVTPEVISKAWNNINKGLILEYLNNKIKKDENVDLIGDFYDV